MDSINKIFKFAAFVFGDYNSNFVFETEEELDYWILNNYMEAKKLCNITFDAVHLPGLQIGDKCNVAGEGKNEFIIIDIVKYSKYRYGFVLDNGSTKDVAKCHNNYILNIS